MAKHACRKKPSAILKSSCSRPPQKLIFATAPSGGACDRRHVATVQTAAASCLLLSRPRPPARPPPPTLMSVGTLRTRRVVAGVRQRSFEKVPRAALPGQSLLESNAVAPATMHYYTDKVAAFEKFLLTVRSEILALTDGVLLETQILAYLDHLFLLGLSVSSGEKVVPALAAVHTQFGSIMKSRHRVQRALRGWRRLRPPISRLPFNWPTICAWATGMVTAGHRLGALALILSAVAYLRPGEVLQLRADGVILPVPGGRGSQGYFAITLFDPLHGRSSKTGQYHDSVVLDGPHSWLGPLLHRRALEVGSSERLFPFEYVEMAAWAAQATLAAGLEVLHPVLYQLRHAGASIDAASRLRSLEEIRARGRWAAATSMMRYEKHAQLGKTWHALPSRVQAYALKCALKPEPLIVKI